MNFILVIYTIYDRNNIHDQDIPNSAVHASSINNIPHAKENPTGGDSLKNYSG